eukprot:CAMPEP_0170541940 /NCGR_PEP_ID=MMETSP0211-20121228/1528_1 /TAXON_ID=311385 /ORGANISM="Pseudokeronopsis sp., Strain OXSARD2" /LENGTH=104 /DNA_ID=CAMNT_0010844851 /DNA_START=1109 /DNA_END=1423 /DNA_ORIENTATION=-
MPSSIVNNYIISSQRSTVKKRDISANSRLKDFVNDESYRESALSKTMRTKNGEEDKKESADEEVKEEKKEEASELDIMKAKVKVVLEAYQEKVKHLSSTVEVLH